MQHLKIRMSINAIYADFEEILMMAHPINSLHISISFGTIFYFEMPMGFKELVENILMVKPHTHEINAESDRMQHYQKERDFIFLRDPLDWLGEDE